MIKLVIFDLDGTLLNSLDDLAASANYVLKKFGYPEHEVEAYRYMVGNGISKLLERALPEDARIQSILYSVKKEFMEYYAEHKADLTKPYDGINELLQNLRHRGVALAIATNKEHENARNLVNHCFQTGTFKIIRGEQPGFPIKPDPAIVFAILNETGVEPHEVLYVGDTAVDMQTAVNSGVKAVGVTWGFRPEKELRESGADYIVHQPAEILDLLAD
ncbi:HAD family hydrolase [Porphyromonadaceae bacterium OttesenSCG-928-L07]|nr:HAD family hydrolase [Porphyromonadaceae bacterium OttesenSCG-928-L07]MDL2251365.1 HAD family hydrolase [Odoribacter sp. OttesenSCG-928-J03]MDL2283228.1 HAD family hydrolase [Odoribacter sp. OttesenSCG-928-G04]MDL2331258.1 HAD family hydrolase [Odoribacter sp. OttesenSCG-928-A06]